MTFSHLLHQKYFIKIQAVQKKRKIINSLTFLSKKIGTKNAYTETKQSHLKNKIS